MESFSGKKKKSHLEAVPDSNIGHGHHLRLVNDLNESDLGTENVENGYEESFAEQLAEKERNGWLSNDQRMLLRQVLLVTGVATSVGVKSELDKQDNIDSFEGTDNPYSETFSPKEQSIIEKIVDKGLVAETDDTVPTGINRPDIPGIVEMDIDGMVEAGVISQFEGEILKLQQSLKPEDVNETYELALKPAEGTGELGRMDYIQQMYSLNSDEAKERGLSAVPQRVWDELGKIVGGWVGQESRFDENRVSPGKAKGPWQYLKIGWKDVRGSEDLSTKFDDQADASMDTVVNNYGYIHNIVGGESMEKLRSQFGSEDEYLKGFMVDLLLTSHNAGPTKVGEELKQFIETVPLDEVSNSKDLFLYFINKSGLSREAKEYAVKVRAWAEALRQEEGEKTQLAQK